MADTEEKRPRFFQANVPVFVGSAVLIFTALLLVVHDPDDASIVFAAIQSWIVHEMGWFYVAAVATFLVFAIGIAASSMGAIKLGPDDSEPDFSTASWFAMLFSAGMGIGIMFYGVAEPVLHFASPPVGEGGTVEAARNAMQLSFFHWPDRFFPKRVHCRRIAAHEFYHCFPLKRCGAVACNAGIGFGAALSCFAAARKSLHLLFTPRQRVLFLTI